MGLSTEDVLKYAFGVGTAWGAGWLALKRLGKERSDGDASMVAAAGGTFKSLNDALLSEIKERREEMDGLRGELKELRDEATTRSRQLQAAYENVSALWEYVSKLEQAIRAAGMETPPRPAGLVRALAERSIYDLGVSNETHAKLAEMP